MKRKVKISTAYVAKIAMLSALAFVLYMYGKFNLPFMFPQFLEMQFSELPALLAGFSMGPVAGALVIIIKCLIKFPFSSTMYVGELMDIILGLFFVLPASIIYAKKKTKKHAIIGLISGTLSATAMSLLFNRFIAIPLYVNAFHLEFSTIVGMLSGLYPKINNDNFYGFYIFVGVLPFNLLRLGLVSIITFFVYKRLSGLLHREKNAKQIVKQTETAVGEETHIAKKVIEVKEENESNAKSDETDAKIAINCMSDGKTDHESDCKNNK